MDERACGKEYALESACDGGLHSAFTEWVPWSVFREPQPLLHGQIASRAEYVALVESMSRTLRGAAARFAIPK